MIDLTTKSQFVPPPTNQTCGAKSFQLRDNVCDDTSNTKKCLYDGGDCCQEYKNRDLCQTCACILDVDLEDLQERFSELDILPVVSSGDLDAAIGDRWILQVEEVVSGMVCASVCLDHAKQDDINSWHYYESTQICRCGWLSSALCPENFVDTTWSQNDIAMVGKTNTFIQLNKTVPCSIGLSTYFCHLL